MHNECIRTNKLHFLSIASLNSKHAHTPGHAYMNAHIPLNSKHAHTPGHAYMNAHIRMVSKRASWACMYPNLRPTSSVPCCGLVNGLLPDKGLLLDMQDALVMVTAAGIAQRNAQRR
jgi:hypothetical protein